MNQEVKLDKSKIPQHIAIIMDGNGRWAKEKGLSRIEGHREGSRNVTKIVEAADKIGIKYMTLYSFSTENWNRPLSEVRALMDLFEETIDREIPDLTNNNVRFRTIGFIEGLRSSTLNKFKWAIQTTKNNTGLTLNIAVNYSGRDEIVRAFEKIQEKDLEANEETIAQNLDTAGMPDPELLIRTSGELRISNFLLWQLAYSEIWITDLFWPDFRPKHLKQAIYDYSQRERRFGAIED